jgi:hypothetical protein
MRLSGYTLVYYTLLYKYTVFAGFLGYHSDNEKGIYLRGREGEGERERERDQYLLLLIFRHEKSNTWQHGAKETAVRR